jgi:hypothetical protein
MMQMKWIQAVVALIGIAACSGAAAQGQEQSAPAPQARTAPDSQIDVGLNVYEAFNQSSSGLGTQQTTTNAVGGMLEGRYILKPYIGFEITYSYNSANQTFTPKTGACAYTCANPPTALTAKANEVGIDYVASKKIGNLRPFLVGGIGFFITAPSNSAYEVTTVVRPAYIFGGGVDWDFLPHFGVRGQFRDNLYKAPNLSALYPATGMYTQTAEPMGGVYFKF